MERKAGAFARVLVWCQGRRETSASPSVQVGQASIASECAEIPLQCPAGAARQEEGRGMVICNSPGKSLGVALGARGVGSPASGPACDVASLVGMKLVGLCSTLVPCPSEGHLRPTLRR